MGLKVLEKDFLHLLFLGLACNTNLFFLSMLFFTNTFIFSLLQDLHLDPQ